ncbi:MAG: sigma-70 family RNA polymerase sigma factor [Micropruina sp.]|uniref:RNA polymerase sigma factor n=1 Tax=Micropruina sp. TaxID=2737536 RepID=UPI0039E3A0F8
MTTSAIATGEIEESRRWPADLLQRLADRDAEIWDRVVRSYRPCIYARAAQLRLRPWQRQDLEQRVWLALLENATKIRDAACLPGWLSTTAHRAGMALLQQECREISVDDVPAPPDRAGGSSVEREILRSERLRNLHDAIAQLSPRQREVVAALLQDLSYEQLAARLGIALGSIGPTRQRALNRLRVALPAA